MPVSGVLEGVGWPGRILSGDHRLRRPRIPFCLLPPVPYADQRPSARTGRSDDAARCARAVPSGGDRGEARAGCPSRPRFPSGGAVRVSGHDGVITPSIPPISTTFCGGWTRLKRQGHRTISQMLTNSPGTGESPRSLSLLSNLEIRGWNRGRQRPLRTFCARSRCLQLSLPGS